MVYCAFLSEKKLGGKRFILSLDFFHCLLLFTFFKILNQTKIVENIFKKVDILPGTNRRLGIKVWLVPLLRSMNWKECSGCIIPAPKIYFSFLFFLFFCCLPGSVRFF